MNQSLPPISDEHLVAYLDGELDPAARERIETQLSGDEALRQRLAGFEQSWNLLDSLPPTSVSDNFSQTTVTMVAQKLATPKRSRWKMWALGIAGGFLVAAIPMRVIQQQRIRDLPVIQNMELYRVADSAKFLLMMEEEGLFVEDVDDVL